MIATQTTALPSTTQGVNATLLPSTTTNQPIAQHSACPMIVPNPPVPVKPTTFIGTADALNEYINRGASVTATLNLLKTWGQIYTRAGSSTQMGFVLMARLLPVQDPQLIAMYMDTSQVQPDVQQGNLVIFECVGTRYQVLYAANDDPHLAGSILNPHFLAADDVTGDGYTDLALTVEDCSNTTCLDDIYILSAHNGRLENIIPDIEWTPAPHYLFRPAADHKTKDLEVQKPIILSPQAGPQRLVTETWSYRGEVYTLTSTLKAPAIYRIHALQDGDEAFHAGDYGTAATLYLRVATDPNLQSWQGLAPLRDEAKVLAAFAYVRMMELAALQRDVNGLQAAQTALIEVAPDNSPGAIYAGLGTAFLTAYNQMQNYSQVCEVVAKYAEKNPNTYLLLGQDTFGYANPDYQAVDMCLIP